MDNKTPFNSTHLHAIEKVKFADRVDQVNGSKTKLDLVGGERANQSVLLDPPSRMTLKSVLESSKLMQGRRSSMNRSDNGSLVRMSEGFAL